MVGTPPMYPKPEPLARVRQRRRRAERQVVAAVRAIVVRRDSTCRLRGLPQLGVCGGPSEWAHLGARRRYRTRGRPSAERHTTAGSLMLCAAHHRAYDQHRLLIHVSSPRGANGPLAFVWLDGVIAYLEPVVAEDGTCRLLGGLGPSVIGNI